MGNGKDDFISATGGFRAGESQQGFQNRVAEIQKLETALQTGQGIKELGGLETIQRRLCTLKGIKFDDPD